MLKYNIILLVALIVLYLFMFNNQNFYTMNIAEFQKQANELRQIRLDAYKTFMANKTQENKDAFLLARMNQVNFNK